MDREAKKERVPLRRSLQSKVALSYFVIILAVLLLLNTYPIFISQNLTFQAKQISMENQASVAATSLAALEELTPEGVARVMELLEGASVTRAIVTDTSGMILYDSSETDPSVGRYALFGEITLALRGYDVFSSDFTNEAFRSRCAQPVVYRNQNIGAIYLYEYDDEQAKLLYSLRHNLQNISLVVFLATLGMSLLFARRLTLRINKLLSATQSIGDGEYDFHVELGGKDELTALAGEFNRMTLRLSQTEEMRRRFVSDASHELKTPLASVKLLTDSILQNDMDRETMKDFVADIGEETERLNRITEKLLTLTRLDSHPETKRELVDIDKVVREVIHLLRPLAEERRITLECSSSSGCKVLATADDLYQIMFNLVENAIKYNRDDGSVFVVISSDDKRIAITVEDTGIGIPEEDMPRIFDRFYRVDKARSREAGGTGLGLSIVRDVAEMHGGVLSVTQREGGGSCFKVCFPAQKEGGE